MKKFFIPAVAALMAVVFSAFTMPKTDSMAKAKTVDLYWYIVDQNTNQIPQNATHEVQSSKADAEAQFEELCPDGDDRDCMRGFLTQLNTSSGPVSAAGDDQIKTVLEP